MFRTTLPRLFLIGVVWSTLGCEQESKLISVLPTLALSSTSVTPVATIGGPPVTETVTIVNGTDGALEGLSVSVQFIGAASGWLAATLSQSTATRQQAASIQLRATPGTLGLGSYLANVVVSAQGAGNGPITIAVRLTIDPRPPAKLALVTQASAQSSNGGTFDQQPVVQLLNAIDEPALKAGVVIAVAIASGGGALLGPATAVTGPDGRAVFTGLGLLGSVGNRTLTFSAPNVTSVVSGSVALVPGAAQRLESASAATQTADAGTAVAEPPRARVVDQSGNGIAGFPITFVSSAGSVITPSGNLTTSAVGSAGPTSWVLNPVAGANTVTASAGGLAGSPLTFTATGRVGAASILAKTSGDNVTGLVNSVLGTPHVAKVTDAFGNGVSGVAISWGVTGGGSVNPTTNVTDANGNAQAVRTLPAAPAAVTTTASATIGGTLRTVSFAVNVVNSGPALIVKVTGDGQTAVAGATLPTALQVRVTNGLGNPEPNAAVAFTTPNGGSFPGGTTVLTDVNGFASTTWTLGTLAGAQTAQAATGGPTPVVFTATANAGAVNASQSSVSASPPTITAGGSGSVITVTARDAFGNPIGGLPVVLFVTGGATLPPPIGLTNASGQATSTLTATIAGAKVVSTAISGVAIAQQATVTVVAGAPTTMSPQTTLAPTVVFGQSVTPAPSVKVLDVFGNGVPNVLVSFTILAGGSTRSPASDTTDASGTAFVSTWQILPLFTGTAVTNTYAHQLQASAAGTSPITFAGTARVRFVLDLATFFRLAPNGTIGGCTGAGCHGAFQPPNYGAANLTLYATLTAGTKYVFATPAGATTNDSTRTIDPNTLTPTNLLWRKPGEPALGHTGGKFAASVVTAIKAWIQQGAPNN